MAAAITWRGDDESEDEELFGSGAGKVALKTALLLVIDATPDMFEEQWGENEDSPFRAALKYCVTICRSKIVSTPRDLVAIMFIGTEKDQNPRRSPNMYLLHPLAQLRVEVIEDLQRMASEDDYDGFEERIGSSSDYSLKDLFWFSKAVLGDEKIGSVNQKLIYFTCQDNPHSRDSMLKNASIQKFKDLGTAVDFNIVTFNVDFLYDRFYKNLFPEPSRITYMEDLQNLRQVVRMRQKTNRPISRLSMQIGSGINIAVGVYSIARNANPPKKYFANGRNNELVTKSVNTFRSDTGTTVLKSEQVKVANVMGEMIPLDKDELRVSKTTESPGITVLGFIPLEKFDQFSNYQKEGYFLYPDEERTVGSTEFFKVLLKRCHALKKAGIVKIILTRGRSAKLACLVPCIDGTNVQRPTVGIGSLKRKHQRCSGFAVCLLPFSDELRFHDLNPGREASHELTTLMEKVIRKTSKKDFDVTLVENPALQTKYRQIEQLALQGGTQFEELPFEDFTETNDDLMEDRIGNICVEINTVVESEHESTAVIPVRKGPVKEVNMAMEAKHKRLDKLTCPVLTDFLISAGVKIPSKSKTKLKLMEMVYNYFEDDD